MRWLAGLVVAGGATAGDFEFSDFASAKEKLFLIGNAHRTRKNELRLTDADQNRRGAAWFREKQTVAEGFEATFTLRLTDQDSQTGGADGFAFVIQNESKSAIGGLGASGGFMRSDEGAVGGFERGILRRLAVFFDTYENQWDGSDNAIAVCTTGAGDLRWPPRCLAYSQKLKTRLKDGKPHSVRVSYEPPRLSIYLDEMADAIRVTSVDLASLIGGDGTAWVGFTASTGGGIENHDILSWKFSTTRGAADSTATTVASSISFLPAPCLPGRQLCTPEKAVVEERGPGQFHVYLPANLEWGASIPDPNNAETRISNVTGVICWDPRLRKTTGCNGPAGNGILPGEDAEGGAGFVSPKQPVGALVVRRVNGRIWFSVNDWAGDGFKDNEGFFEFDVAVKQ